MKEFTQEQISDLSRFVDSQRFSTGQSNRKLHLHDISAHSGHTPAGIIWPVATEVVLVGDPEKRNEWSLLEDINAQIVTRAVQLGGNCTDKHGIGKRRYMQLEHGDSYELMRQIKDLIDTKGLLNPGKIFLKKMVQRSEVQRLETRSETLNPEPLNLETEE
jgi:FAD/FMN-containing dehydrogenase